MLTLFYTPGACSMVPHIALEEAGAQYQTVLVDFRSGDQFASYLRRGDRGDPSRCPAVMSHWERVRARPAVERVLRDEGLTDSWQ
jgi:glutathione S-transferase